jgi:hypothetical protein
VLSVTTYEVITARSEASRGSTSYERASDRYDDGLTSNTGGSTRVLRQTLRFVEPRTIDWDDERRGEEDVDDDVHWRDEG